MLTRLHWSFIIVLIGVAGIALLAQSALPVDQARAAPSTAQARSAKQAKPVVRAPQGRPRVLEWDDLVPADFRPENLLADTNGIASLSDTDPKAIALLAKLKKLYDEAPVVGALDNALVKMPGYAIPLDQANGRTLSFLLVPYYGACIHEPPPPANQMVFVSVPAGTRIEHAFDVVYVTGVLRARSTNTRYANAGYSLRASKVEPYRVEDDPGR